jgi:D-alanyl-D-alanine-carboxypeptidase/D-alanyl-D-alanine-endopeptidase
VFARRGLSRKSWDTMLTPQIRIREKSQFPVWPKKMTDANDAIELSYGLGWGIFKTPYGRAFFKEGHDDGWRNYTVCFDKTGTGIVIMTNSSNGEGIFKELLEGLLGNTYTPIRWEGYSPYDSQK